ncbi:MAG: hypothetical protein OEX02_18720, partial [Cyclobacteriaceae bacterium]|nr:hypothetical protein [Cyclobacteriaceae bacterium]
MHNLKWEKNFLLVLFVVLIQLSYQPLLAQTSPEDAEMALLYMEQGDLMMADTRAEVEARDLYKFAADLDPNNITANLKTAQFYLITTDKQEAAKYFLRVKELNPDHRFDIDYQIGL